MSRHLSRFILTGLAATAVHYLVLSACVNVLAIDPVIATFPAFAFAFLLGYTLNRNWTFGSNAQHCRALPAYFGLALLSLANNALLNAASGTRNAAKLHHRLSL
jgi:putative flippase GtrA